MHHYACNLRIYENELILCNHKNALICVTFKLVYDDKICYRILKKRKFET